MKKLEVKSMQPIISEEEVKTAETPQVEIVLEQPPQEEGTEKAKQIEFTQSKITDPAKIIEIKKGLNVSTSEKEQEIKELQAKERILRIRNTNNWVEQVGNKIENPNLAENNIEVFSDEQLQTEDVEFIIATKVQLDNGGGKPIRIIILDKKHWLEFMSLLGRDESRRQFDGRAEEDPIVPADVNNFLVLPSSEVFSQDTSYRRMYSLSPKVREMIDQSEGAVVLYRGIYLRNVLSHEMAHLYQFSSAEIQDISQSNDAEYQNKYNKFLETREFLSCMFGLFNLKKHSQTIYEAYIDACQQLIKSGIRDAHVIEQAKRSLDSVRLLSSFADLEIEDMFSRYQTICRDGDDSLKDGLQNTILSVRSGEMPSGQLRGVVVK